VFKFAALIVVVGLILYRPLKGWISYWLVLWGSRYNAG
jgi:hypothetical protein